MPRQTTLALSRRDFLALSAACGARLTLTGRAFADDGAPLEEPWARIEEIGDGLWAVVSKPLAEPPDYRTLCNGGLIAGRERVLAFDGYARPDGAKWVAEAARRLTGRWPTDVLISHYHGDHTNGLGGFLGEGERPRLWITAATRDLVRKTAEESGQEDAARSELLAAATLVDTAGPTELDLGGRTVRLHPRSGHTPSDVTVELDEPSVVFAGDLVWNRMFPNYRDAVPSELSRSVRALMRKRPTVYVTGHGPLADTEALGRYLTVIDDVEAAARRAFEKGVPAAQAAGEYRLPDSVRDWHLFRATYFESAIGAWHRELGSA